MIARGHVKNGVVVLEEGVRFPEGQVVAVFGPSAAPTAQPLPTPALHSVLDVPAVSLGSVLPALTGDDDLLSEMLDGRP